MDALSSLLPPTPPPLALTVNGRPLNEVLTVVANALRSQQEDVRQFKLQHQHDMSEVARRFQELEARIHRIETDLQIQRRPFVAYGQPAMPTAYDAIASIEYRVHRSSNAVRANVEKDILTVYQKSVLQRYFRKLQSFALVRAAVKKMEGTSKVLVMRSAFEQWGKGIARLKENKANARKAQSLLYTVEKKLAARYLQRFILWHVDLNERLGEKRRRDLRVANELAAFNLRGTVRRYFNKWAQFQDHLKFNASRYRQAQRLEALSHQRLALSAFDRWAEFTNYRLFEVRRSRAIATRQKQTLRALALRYLDKWQRYIAVQHSRRARLVHVTRMFHSVNLQLAHRYFDKILRFVTYAQQRRRVEELATYLTLLAKKYDSLGEQLDLSLDNISHTNGVLSRVVDTIILTNPDAPHVRSLLGAHCGDQSSVTTRIQTQQHGDLARDARSSSEAGVFASSSYNETNRSHLLVHAPLPSRHQDEAAPSTYNTTTTRGHTATPAQAMLNARALSRSSSSSVVRHENRLNTAQTSRTSDGGLNISHSVSTAESVRNRRQRMLSPSSNNRENPERRVLSVRELIANASPETHKESNY